MPELPEVETVRRALARALPEGRTRIVGAVRSRQPLRDLHGPSLPFSTLAGARIDGWDRHGKVLLVRLEGPRTLAVHLGMSGRLELAPPDGTPPAHGHLRLDLDGGAVLWFRDPRRFGSLAVLEGHRSGADLGLGPDALATPWTATRLAAVLAGTGRSIFDALLDQRRVAGLGNIYVQEILHAAGIDPRAAAGRLASRTLARLAARIRPVLRAAIERGGTTLRDHRAPDGRPGSNAAHLRVYGRAGARCGCGGRLRGLRLGGRTVTFCPRCQRTGRPRRRG